ncbi:BTAD domain-containing putative transcriptional regulator [Streptomyces monticola]|uniref:BTAD domain-containing putative transcriptional regulator n=1 Tax=Streptomyces monticola TaxID=2666263 RepID=A0ABW2JN18_9ACTN
MGVPVMLLAAVGMPWPQTPVGSFSELWERLAEPMTDQLVLEVLALVGWFCWAVFVWSLIGEIVWYARHISQVWSDRHAHSLHLEGLSAPRALAAFCVGTLLIGMLSLWRPGHAAAQAGEMLRPTVVATVVEKAVHGDLQDQNDRRDRHAVYVVEPGDTLWDIAERKLGDPLKWPRIYALSKDVLQPGGVRLSDPDVLLPGWNLRLPVHTLAPGPEHEQRPPEPGGSSEPIPSGAPTPGPDLPEAAGSGPSPRPSTSATAAPDHHRDAPSAQPATVSLGQAAAIGITSAAGIAAAVALAAAHRQRRHRPGAEATEAAPFSTTVRTATWAARAAARDLRAPDGDEAAGHPPIAHRSPHKRPLGLGTVTVASNDGTEIPLDELAVAGGTQWAGVGAVPAVRALLMGVLTAAERERPQQPSNLAVLPRDVADELLPDGWPEVPALTVVDSVHRAVVRAEEHLVAHARRAMEGNEPTTGDDGDTAPPPRRLVLITRGGAAEDSSRLAAVAAQCAPNALVVVVLGGLHGAASVEVSEDGDTTAAQLPGIDRCRMFRMDASSAVDVLAMLSEAHGADSAAGRHTEIAATPHTDTAKRADVAPPARALPISRADLQSADRKQTGGSEAGVQAQRALVQAEPVPRRAPILLRVLGPIGLTLTSSGEAVGTSMRSAAREMLALLAAHPDGMRTEEIAEHLQLPTDPDESAKEMKNVRRAIRRALRKATGSSQAGFVRVLRDREFLDPQLISTDLAEFTAALRQSAVAENVEQRASSLRGALAAYAGPFADGADYVWAEEVRENLYRKAVDATVALADLLTPTRLDEALVLLDRAVEWNPLNEAVYARIIRLQQAEGRDDAAQRTYALLETRLRAIEAEPSPATRSLISPRTQATPVGVQRGRR